MQLQFIKTLVSLQGTVSIKKINDVQSCNVFFGTALLRGERCLNFYWECLFMQGINQIIQIHSQVMA